MENQKLNEKDVRYIGFAGSRSYTSKIYYEPFWKIMNLIDWLIDRNVVVIHGGAKGADGMMEHYCQTSFIKTMIWKPKYAQFGNGAPLVRDLEIVKKAKEYLVFWDLKSRGTAYVLERIGSNLANNHHNTHVWTFEEGQFIPLEKDEWYPIAKEVRKKK